VKKLRSLLALGIVIGSARAPAPARASTGVCDVSPGENGASEIACINAIAALRAGHGRRRHLQGLERKTGDQLIYGQLVDPFGGLAQPTAQNGCPQANTICNGDLTSSQGTPAVICTDFSHDFAVVSGFVGALDWKYANPIRMLDNHPMQGAPYVNCPDWSKSVTDGNKEGYRPWEGMVFDLGGPSNKVVLFPVNDHGPQPCESVEYTVYLTDNPLSRDLIDNPTTSGADPQKWNRAKLSQLFLEGWKKVRPGSDISIPEPGRPQQPGREPHLHDRGRLVHQRVSLPCGINFRYVGIIAGNDGKDLPACNFDSFDAEIDAVAGLTEGGAGICPDADGDKFVDCNCPTAPMLCDCNDGNPAVHPARPSRATRPTSTATTCLGAARAIWCVTRASASPRARAARTRSARRARRARPRRKAPSACPTTAPSAAARRARCARTASACPRAPTWCAPARRSARTGSASIRARASSARALKCARTANATLRGNCFAGDVGCVDQPMTVCDAGNTNACVPPLCKNVQCGPAQHCDPMTGMCVDFCNPGVKCPQYEVCVDGVGCVPLCNTVTCDMASSATDDRRVRGHRVHEGHVPAADGVRDGQSASTRARARRRHGRRLGRTRRHGRGRERIGNGERGGLGTGGAHGGGSGDKGSCGCRVPGDAEPGAPLAVLLVVRGSRASARAAGGGEFLARGSVGLLAFLT